VSDTTDLLAALAPAPSEDDARPVGALQGTTEGLGAGISAWCGPGIGWRPLGEIAGACLVRHQRRLRIAVVFDLGEAPPVGRAE